MIPGRFFSASRRFLVGGGETPQGYHHFTAPLSAFTHLISFDLRSTYARGRSQSRERPPRAKARRRRLLSKFKTHPLPLSIHLHPPSAPVSARVLLTVRAESAKITPSLPVAAPNHLTAMAPSPSGTWHLALAERGAADH
eukprot:scaffold266166_cov26-Tisochrysis_lutea.AAC.1